MDSALSPRIVEDDRRIYRTFIVPLESQGYGSYFETGWHYHDHPPHISEWVIPQESVPPGVTAVIHDVGPAERVTVLTGLDTRRVLARIAPGSEFDLDVIVRVERDGEVWLCPVFGGRPTNNARCAQVDAVTRVPPQPPPKVVIE